MISFFIPVRKNSKRVKNKNTRPLPNYRYGLTELKILQLAKFRNLIKRRKYNLFNKCEFIVSTNCKKVKRFAKKFNWIKIHERNSLLSNDKSLVELIDEIPNICSGKFILWTHVTSPFFTEHDYFNFLNYFFKKNKKNRSAFSADIIQKFIYREDKKWVSHNYKKQKWPRTQDLPKLYSVNSAAFIAPVTIYKKNKDRLCNSPIPIVSKNKSGFDVDTISDFNFLKKKLKYENKFKL
jgi:N-acylneuraminate cytidylyltransferase